jgi:hypothetical protein
LEEARLRLQREEEIETKRQARRLEEKQRATSSPVPRSVNGDTSIPTSPSVGALRLRANPPASSPLSPQPVSAPYRPPAARSHTPSNGTTPPRSETPPSSGRPSIFGSGRMREERPATPPTVRPSPFGGAKPVDRPSEKEKIVDVDGFQQAPAGKWRARTRGPGEAPPR